MATHRECLRACMFGRAARIVALICFTILLFAALPGLAAQAESAKSRPEEVDTEHMFGFTEGSEIGEKGETEFMSESTGRLGKVSGSYTQIASLVEAKYTLADRFRVSAAATVAYYDISGTTGLDDRRQGLVQAVSSSARYRVLNHQDAPFALTLSVEPRWGFVEERSGARADEIGAEFAALADWELVPAHLYGAINLSYEPERTRLHGTIDISRDATVGFGAAVTALTFHGIFVGIEVRYLRQYEGLPISNFGGQAFYIGPTFYANLGEHALISAAWNTQAWGSALGRSGALDLVHFERHQVKLRLAVSF